MKRILAAICALFLPTPLAAQGVAPAEMVVAIPMGTGESPNAMGPEIWYGTPGDMSVRDTIGSAQPLRAPFRRLAG